jgi:hypothetical protein
LVSEKAEKVTEKTKKETKPEGKLEKQRELKKKKCTDAGNRQGPKQGGWGYNK